MVVMIPGHQRSAEQERREKLEYKVRLPMIDKCVYIWKLFFLYQFSFKDSNRHKLNFKMAKNNAAHTDINWLQKKRDSHRWVEQQKKLWSVQQTALTCYLPGREREPGRWWRSGWMPSSLRRSSGSTADTAQLEEVPKNLLSSTFYSQCERGLSDEQLFAHIKQTPTVCTESRCIWRYSHMLM